MRRPLRLPLILAVASASAACAARPARFADAPPITEVADDLPIPIPQRIEPIDAVYVTDVYIRRPVVSALDPSRLPDAGDVNAVDDVPRSSWFDPSARGGSDGPPRPPLAVEDKPPDSGLGGLTVVDARGIHYEIRRDPPNRPDLTTSAAVIASTLLRAIGYFTPEVWVMDLAKGDLTHAPDATAATGRIAAIRWPIGVDVGATAASIPRGDDPNDRVPHGDRRTLRALKTALYWVGMRRLWPGALRDTYIGKPGQGYLRHYLVGLEDALEAAAVTHPDSELDGEPALRSFLTLGLSVPRPKPAQTKWPAIGAFSRNARPADFHTGPPFEPIDRATAADVYWMAKRIAAVSQATIDAAIAGAHIHDNPSRVELGEVLAARRRALILDAYARVSPLEVDRVEQGRVILRDEAVVQGIAKAEESRYRIAVIDDEGYSLAKTAWVRGAGANVEVPIKRGRGDYVVIRVTSERAGKRSPRAMEVHLTGGGALRLVGVRH